MIEQAETQKISIKHLLQIRKKSNHRKKRIDTAVPQREMTVFFNFFKKYLQTKTSNLCTRYGTRKRKI